MDNLKKGLILILLISAVFAAYYFVDKPEPIIEEEFETYEAEVEAELVEVSSQAYLGEPSFSVYLSRLDKEMAQKDFLKDDTFTLTSDLPAELQPKLMYVINEEGSSKRMCDRPRLPHECAIKIEDFEGKESAEFLLKITFEDGGYAETSVTVPAPIMLPVVEITKPKKAPQTRDTFELSFEEVGAENYDIEVRVCEEYAGDGSNPCMTVFEYRIKKVEDGSYEFANGVEGNVELKVKNGEIEIKSDEDIYMLQSIEYLLRASSEIEKDGITYYADSITSLHFEEES